MTDILTCAGVAPDSEEAMDVTKACIEKMRQQASVHFAQPYLNTATIAGLFRMLLKALAQKYEVAFPIPSQDKSKPKTPWWKE